jgi:Casjensviridae head maturation protease
MSMASFAREIAGRLHHRGVLINPEYPGIAADLREIANADLAEIRIAEAIRRRELVASYGLGLDSLDKPYAFSQGVAVIPIHGILINRMSWGSSYATGYNYVADLYRMAVADPDVEAIVFDVNSPGGVASGAGELAQELFTRAKPSLAVIDSRAYSAAYWIASAADQIAVTPSGGVGSIGVVAMHVDLSQALEQDGIKVSFIHAGAEKVDGNPFQPLSDRARASIQKDVDYHYGMFVGGVAQNRDLSEDDVRATEAACYLPDEALELGLIDTIATPEAALSQFLDRGSTATMPAETTAANTSNDTATIATVVAEALRADRARAAAIRTSTEAAGKTRLAEHLATNTELSVDVARGILAAAAPEPKEPSPNGFADAMRRTPNPDVGADNGGGNGSGGTEDTPSARATRILANYAKATGTKPVKVIEHDEAA